MSGRVVAVIQARMGSTRRPGKVLAELHGRPMLEFMLDRVQRARLLDDVVVATSDEPRDEPIAAVAARLDVPVIRGSETDVLGRILLAAQESDATTVVRLTADCPLLDPAVIDRCVATFQDDAGAHDLVTTAPPEGRSYPDGMDVEVLALSTLATLAEQVSGSDREHVTQRLHRPPYRVLAVHLPEDLGQVRLTVDHEEDLTLVREIVSRLGERAETASLDEILAAR